VFFFFYASNLSDRIFFVLSLLLISFILKLTKPDYEIGTFNFFSDLSNLVINTMLLDSLIRRFHILLACSKIMLKLEY
jgi:hypothetical protein